MVNVSDNSHSGIIFKIARQTKYYKHELSIMVDEYPEKRETETTLADLNRWKDEFSADEMAELRAALDGFLFCIDVDNESSIEHLDDTMDTLENIYEVLGGIEWPGFIAVVAFGGADHELVEDAATLRGIEYINMELSGVGEFRDKLGRDRLVELLDTHEWSDMNVGDYDSYDSRKKQMALEMTQPLLESESDNTETAEKGSAHNVEEFDRIVEKLKQARLKADSLEGEEKEAYAKQVMEDVLLYI